MSSIAKDIDEINPMIIISCVTNGCVGMYLTATKMINPIKIYLIILFDFSKALSSLFITRVIISLIEKLIS